MKTLFLIALLELGFVALAPEARAQGGVPLWTNRYNGPVAGANDQATAIAVDRNGNVFVTGFSSGSGSDFDYATIKYSNAGIPLWTNRHDGWANSSDYAYALAVDDSGNVFVTGIAGGECATIKYSGAGVALWTNRYGSGIGRALAVDGSGNVVVTGDSDQFRLDSDYATIKYSGDGVPLWTNRYDLASTVAVAVDANGNAFVTGMWNGFTDYMTIAYSSAGVALWTNRYHGPGNGSGGARAVAVDGHGNVFVTGFWNGGDNDYVTIKYSSSIPVVRLNFQNANNALVLSWPTNATGFRLQSATNLNPPILWSDFTNTRVVVGTNFALTNATSAAVQFFRLQRP